jgi:hypothetical protein
MNSELIHESDIFSMTPEGTNYMEELSVGNRLCVNTDHRRNDAKE